MNELLGWYGYDKVELRDSEASEIRNYRERRQHVSVLKENSLPKPKGAESEAGHSVLAMKSGERESTSMPCSSSSSSSPSSSLTSHKEHKSAPVIVPLIKPSAVEDVQNVQIVCVWCQKEGVKRYSLCMGSELKSFCSEKCFAACRRAYFKRNKARDEDVNADTSPQHPHSEDSPRLVLKMNSTVRPPQSLSPASQVCDWCKHVRHTKEYLDFGSGEERLQFCSTKCLNQYKMDVFYREARAALTSTPSSSSSPGRSGQEGRSDSGPKLLTPESWSSGGGGGGGGGGGHGGVGDLRHRTRSPKGHTPSHASAASSSVSPSEASSSSSSKVPVSGLRLLERPMSHPPPAPPQTAEGMPHRPPHPHPHPNSHPHPHQRSVLDHPPMPPMPMPFIRPPLHAQGLKSPLSHHPRHPGPPSSPIHRAPHSPHPHMQPPPVAPVNPPGLMHPFLGAYFPGLHSPPINMMPRGPVPMHPMMNFGIPSFSPLLPHPMVLVPYPVIVPLPVPIPIPIPFPFPVPCPAQAPTVEKPSHGGVIQPVPEDRSRGRAARQPCPPGSPSDARQQAPSTLVQTPMHGVPSAHRDPNTRGTDWVKSERPFPSPISTPHSQLSSPCRRNNDSPSSAPGLEGLIDCKSDQQQNQQQQQQQQQQPERQVIQRVLQNTQVKLEPSTNGAVDFSGPGESETGQGTRPGLHDIIRPAPLVKHSSAEDISYHHHNTDAPPSHTAPSSRGSSPPYDSASFGLTTPDHGPNRASPSSPGPPSPPGPEPVPAQTQAPPTQVALGELEAIKENNYSAVGAIRADRPAGQSDEPVAVVGEVGEDPHVPDEDHAYALPTAPKTGGAATPLLLPKLRDKGALRGAPTLAAAADTEPALKRRCLRIRDQNK
ncbi:sine oculis-binding protein homolog B isoform X2 [Gadus morhua]|nr:sine oculis-binding protein homolog B-like isoform X2 [Gadus morhua]